MKRKESVDVYSCDFCGREEDAVNCLVASPSDTVHICDECASDVLDLICRAMKKEKGGEDDEVRAI